MVICCFFVFFNFLAPKLTKITCVYRENNPTHAYNCPFLGKLNVCYNALDRHVLNGMGDETAVIYDSPITDTITSITYNELLREVRLELVL